MSLTCPNCAHILEVKVVAKTPRPRRTSDIAVLTDTVLLDVFSYMKTRGEQEGSTAGLYVDYLTWTKLRKPPTKAAFAQALSRNGAVKWRNAQARGWTIGAIDENAKPAKMSAEQRERFEADHQRQAVQEHRGGGWQPDREDQTYTPGGEVEEKPGLPDDIQARIDAGLPPF